MFEPTILVPGIHAPCAFCGRRDGVTELTLPWRKQNVGWWCCDQCVHTTGRQALYTAMDTRRIVGISALPEWFMEHGIMNVCRSDGTLTPMQLIAIDCSFSCNEGNVTSEGRVCLSRDAEPKLYIDMMTVDEDDDNETKTTPRPPILFKQVPLQNLYDNNPALLDHGPLQLRLPPWVSESSQHLWTAAVERAFAAAQKNPATLNKTTHLSPVVPFEDENPDVETDTEEEETILAPSNASKPLPTTLPCALANPPPVPVVTSWSSGTQRQRPTLPPGVELHSAVTPVIPSIVAVALPPPPRLSQPACFF
jgi:hypothetical protein